MKFYRLSGATFYDCINIIQQFIQPFLDNKMSISEEYGAFKRKNKHCVPNGKCHELNLPLGSLYLFLNWRQRNPDGFMQWPEFLELQRCLLAWHSMFRQFDFDKSNFIEANELAGVINKFGMYMNTASNVEIEKIFLNFNSLIHQSLVMLSAT